jgi:hypothetical protein
MDDRNFSNIIKLGKKKKKKASIGLCCKVQEFSWRKEIAIITQMWHLSSL